MTYSTQGTDLTLRGRRRSDSGSATTHRAPSALTTASYPYQLQPYCTPLPVRRHLHSTPTNGPSTQRRTTIETPKAGQRSRPPKQDNDRDPQSRTKIEAQKAGQRPKPPKHENQRNPQKENKEQDHQGTTTNQTTQTARGSKTQNQTKEQATQMAYNKHGN